MSMPPADTRPVWEMASVGAYTDDADAVLALAKAARGTVGFLPDSAFHERARQGTLLAIRSNGGALVAYALFDLPATRSSWYTSW